MPRPAQDGPTITLFDRDPFVGFGPSRFRPPDVESIGFQLKGRGETLRPGVRDHAPKLPGVYAMLDGRGRVAYVGKAKCLRSRLMSYFRTESRDPKAGRILARTRALVWEPAANEFAALLRELELIRRFRPRFNVLGQPGPRRYVYLCLGRPPAPYAFLTRTPTGKELACYGPLIGRALAVDAVRRLNDWFRLRDCPSTVRMAFAERPGLFATDGHARCLRYDLATCLGPCAELCTQKNYSANVRAARAFLDGKDKTVLNELTQQMTAASIAMKYEQATALRDRLQLLTWISDKLTFLRTARQGGAYVYPLTGADGTTIWYFLARGEVRGAVRAPNTTEEHATAITTMTRAFEAPPGDVTDKTVDSVLLVSAWFRKHVTERAKLMTPRAAERIKVE